MSTTLYVGPPASGKTQLCLEAIGSLRTEHPRAPLWVVLPNRAQVVAFRRRFAQFGGGLGVRIETIDAFTEELTVRLGCQRPRAAGPVRRRLVAAALFGLEEAGSIPHYSPIAGTAGLSYLLSERFQEIKRAGWSPVELESELESTEQPAKEMARIFASYQQQLDSLGWEDDEGLAQLAAAELARQPKAVEGLAGVIFDGFDSFSTNQLALLAGLANTDLKLILTLPSRTGEAPDFERYQSSFEELTAVLPKAEIENCGPSEYIAPAIANLSGSLFSKGQSAPAEAGRSVQWVRARSVNAEVREALRWIKSLVRREGIPLQACGLIVSEPESYESFIREAAQEYGIPLRFGLGRQLQQAPSMVALLDLLRLPLANWKRRLTLEAIRTPFFDLTTFGLTQEDAAELEAASYWGQVVEGLEQWSEALAALAGRDQAEGADEEQTTSIPLPSAAAAERLQRALVGFTQRMEPGGPRSLSDWVMWLEDLLQDFDFFKRVGTVQEQAAALRLREVLRAMLLSEKIMGPGSLGYRAFLAELEGSMERARYQPKPEWDRAALQVEGIEAVRGLRFMAAAVIGLSEGQFPSVEREDPLIPDRLRRQLGLEPRIGRDQPSLFYSAVSRADKRLLLTRPTLAQDGETWEPSPYWRESLQVFGRDDQTVPLVRRGAERPMADAASPQEVTFLAVRRQSLPKAFESLEPRLEPLRRSRDLIQARLQDQATGIYEGDLNELADFFSRRLGPDHLWSPSRFENFGTCPHYYLVSNQLNLERLEEPVLGPDASQLGSLLHEILEFAYQSVEDPTDVELVLDDLRQIAATEFERAPEKFGFRPSPLWDVEKERFLASLEDCVLGLAEEGSDWQPFGYEAKFGLAGSPPLEIETDQGRVLVRGVIDRLDRQGDRLRVIDYKTGSSHLDRGDLIDGRRLQLPLYAMAAEKSLELGEVSAGMYWAILAAKAGGLRLERFYADWEGERLEGVSGSYQIVKKHIASFLESMRAGQFQPVPPSGGCPSYCPAAEWCWRYTPGFRR